MMTFIIVSLSLMMIWSISSMNPIKVSMTVLSVSAFLFFCMSVSTGMTWFPTLLLMLFMGGIIMMFMILSSILPNEKSMKSKMSVSMIAGMVTLFMLSFNTTHTLESISSNSNTFLMGAKNFIFMIDLILLYFLVSMSMIASEKTPMRSVNCY